MKTLVIAVMLLGSRAALAGGTADPLDGIDESAVNVGGGDHPMGQRLSERVHDFEQRTQPLEDFAGRMGTVSDAIQGALDMFQALNELDHELDGRIQDDHSGPEVPSSCADREGCNECFAHAYGEVNFVRITLERLRTISARTINFISKAESFGDSTASMTGLAGLSWQNARGGIEEARDHFNQTARTKYDALVQAMEHDLHAVGDCEQQFMNNPDWYSRYGFMYLNFIKEAYRPKD